MSWHPDLSVIGRCGRLETGERMGQFGRVLINAPIILCVGMTLREAVAPSSMNQVVLVVLLWAGINVVLSVFYPSPLFRWEVLIGTAVLGVWILWAVQYRLAQFAQKQKR